ncbi:hypothetical protein D3C72_327620 [compost metagenome]
MFEVTLADRQEVNLKSLVQEAFIEPIRSVLIIDDQYPTWENVFSDGFDPSDESRWQAKSNISALIGQFRQKSKAMTVDIHDGLDNSDIGTYLHQSDLLVLDYQLEKGGNDGDRAIAIMKSLFKNRHFNLIVMHTASDLDAPFQKVLDSLLRPSVEVLTLGPRGMEIIANLEEEHVEDFNLADIWQKLKNTIGRDIHYLYRQYLQKGKEAAGFVRTEPRLSAFRDLCVRAGLDVNDKIAVFCSILHIYEEHYRDDEDRPIDIRWSAPGQGRRPWIRTPGGFVAFAGKNDPHLLTALSEAIEDWKPSPSRLISSKIRSAISTEGAYAEESALNESPIYWQYYNELSRSASGDTSESHRKSLLEAYAARHTERLLDVIGGKAIEFGIKLVRSDPGLLDATVDGFSSHYNIQMNSGKDKTDALYRYNSHISTKSVSGWHLHPGHIFKLYEKYWVCVSPACDLLPNQKGQAAISESIPAKIKPFMAVQLHPRSKTLSKEDINSNTYVFLKDEDGTVKAYSAYEGGQNPAPVWRLFNADNFGIIEIDTPTRSASLKLHYLCGKTGELSIRTSDVKIIAQLRYEYALNLIQKLGTEMTRVGLDYLGPT